MKRLRELARESLATEVALPSGRRAKITNLTIGFPAAPTARLPEGTLRSTYTSKPLVEIDGESLFGELAIVRLLVSDGWSAVWADTFHGAKFWADMPHRASPVQLPPRVRQLYGRIVEIKGSAAGCFDVIAWRGERVVFLEYKGPKDRPNRNELLWIDAALSSGVREEDLFFVGAAARRSVPQKAPEERSA